MSATAVSDWPTPTVSTSTTSKPAASTTTIASRVALATPPSVPEVGEGRMNASGSADSRAIRVLSPRMLPPVPGGGRVDGQHGDPVALPGEQRAERVDEGRLADAGHAGDAHPPGLARSGVSSTSSRCASAW